MFRTRMGMFYVDPEGNMSMFNSLFEDVDTAKAKRDEVNKSLTSEYGHVELRRVGIIVDDEVYDERTIEEVHGEPC